MCVAQSDSETTNAQIAPLYHGDDMRNSGPPAQCSRDRF